MPRGRRGRPRRFSMSASTIDGPAELAVPGTHDFVLGLLRRFVEPPGRALDLGAGTGAFANRLTQWGFDCLAVDADRGLYQGAARFCHADLDDCAFASRL